MALGDLRESVEPESARGGHRPHSSTSFEHGKDLG
jgi:hypothetical protein